MFLFQLRVRLHFGPIKQPWTEMKLNCYAQLKLKCSNKICGNIIVPLKQHIPSETNYMLSPLENYVNFLRQPVLFEWRGRLAVQHVQTFFRLVSCEAVIHVETWVLWASLFNLSIWGWLHHLFWLSSLLLYLSRGCYWQGLRDSKVLVLNCREWSLPL